MNDPTRPPSNPADPTLMHAGRAKALAGLLMLAAYEAEDGGKARQDAR